MSSTAEHIRYFAEKYSLYGGIFNLIIGSISNIFIVIIFTNIKSFRGNQCSFYFIVESLSNISLITTMYVSRIVTLILGYDPISVSIVWCKMRAMIVQGCGLYSLLIICLNTIDQYLGTNHLYRLRQMSTMKLAHRVIGFSGLLTLLHSSIFLVFNNLQPSMGCTVYNSILRKYLSIIYYPIIGNAFPLLITVTFSLLAYRNVRRIVRRQIPIVRRRLDQQLTAMVLTRVLCLIILGLPYIINSIYKSNLTSTGNNSREIAISALVSAVVTTLLYGNFSVTFLFI